ncbi:Crp/Fnr family transcriptional regulator [Sphingobium sp. CR2-8]|uniref:Crp/Fnr family transcriptional regulator n=1 Tax=Sphingobium sp. CR2-8 TaxID=1306534 RepID=UPI002DB99988|nr:Crp/Fnr family transcriptional regulator [Sphingobium sp. CR2-8]MEC3909215.1 Crp/Fnr family transcriptional regulator [Sphingobium sp. CR2-8]
MAERFKTLPSTNGAYVKISLSLSQMLSKLMLRMPLDPRDQAAVLALPHIVRKMRVHEFIARENDQPSSICLLLSGFAFQHRISGDGRRQIFSLHMAGDLIDLQNAILQRADQNVQALSSVEVALIPIDAIRAIALSHPAVGQAMWYETLANAALIQEWGLNASRRNARASMAHILCDLATRMEIAGLGQRNLFDLPMTQEQLGDALALTTVHVSRTFRALAEDELITRHQRTVEILDFARLAAIGEFDDRYLHLNSSFAQQPQTG